MAHYAKLDENNIVTDVIVIANEDCLDENGNECEEPGRCLCEALTGHANWKKTSFNTRLGTHYNINTGEPSEDQSKAFRLNYAEIGMKYDDELNGFIITGKNVPKLLPRMVINPKTGSWILPKPNVPPPEEPQFDLYPVEEYRKKWHWNELNQVWFKMKKTEAIEFCYLYEDML